ncbi:MAG: chaperone modulator CbpM [Candidatus Tectomicrobia bacterium]|nr:chaperone modulator CbpM [Candidatus Tectomicrobia bacterium]
MRTPPVNRFMIRRKLEQRPLSLEEVAARCGLHPLLVERLVALGLIDPVEGESNRFAPAATLRLQRALRLRRDFSLSYNGVALVLELLDRIEALERRLDQYERTAVFNR